MSFRRLRSYAGNFAERRRQTERRLKRLSSRQNLLQQLEDRRLLAGPELIAIRPDSAGLLQEGDTLNIAPREFNLLFKGGASIDESSISSDSIKLTRSGADGLFDTADDVDVALGYIGLAEPGSSDPLDLQQVVFRPSSSASHNSTNPAASFPDDNYRILVSGTGADALTNLSGEAFNDGTDLTTTFRLDRRAQVVAVVPQPIQQSGSVVSQSSNQIIVYFDDQLLDVDRTTDPRFYRLVDTSESLSISDDTTLLPESVAYDPSENKATLTFADDIPEGTYRLDIGQSQGDNSSLTAAVQVGTLFDGSAFTENGFLGDVNGDSDDSTDIDSYRLELIAGSTLNIELDPHSETLNLQARLLDAAGAELAVAAAGPGLSGTISLAISNSDSYFIEISSIDGSTGSYGISANVAGNSVSQDDDNSSISSATELGVLGAAPKRVTSRIQAQNIPLPPRAGSEDEPGHRQIQREQHIGATGTTPTRPQAVTVRRYYFPDTLGTDSSGNAYPNLITEAEKQIVREIYEIYAQLSGFEFIETSATTPGSSGTMIGKGDLRSLDPTIGPNSGVAGLGGSRAVVMNGALFDNANRFFGDGFSGVTFHEIGHSLGLGHAYDQPATMGSGVPNDVEPGDHDIVHLQRIKPPNSTDIDMYRFELEEAGRLTAETTAERRVSPSLLDSVLTLYRQVGNDIELVARNDQYFGADSFLNVQLEAGVYFIGVTSAGNDSYDPRIPDSGFGGTTDGLYDLNLSFVANRSGALRDADGTRFDGDGDGQPGGVYSYWFQASDADTTIFVNKLTDTTAGPEGSGTTTDPYDTIDFALAQAGSRIVVPVDGVTSLTDGQQFVIDDGLNRVAFRFGTIGGNPIDLAGTTNSTDVANRIAAAINNSAASPGGLSVGVTASVNGRVVQLSGIDNLDLSASETLLNTPNLVQVLGNGGADGNVDTLADNQPYLVGLDTGGNPLADGAELLVPQGVTLTIHAGALLKMRKANIDAGSSSANISRSQSAIQVLGTPQRSVFLRSYHNDTVGGDSDGIGSAPRKGDFGGIVFREDSDLEQHGIFLNHVNHADINNGGGKVFVDASELVFAPIDITDARPTVSFNRITSSEAAAISASPDSFDDSLGRVGPDVQGNFLQSNTIDGMFIRVQTPLGSAVEELTVNGRFDDTDVTHVLSETLIVSGGAGGAFQLPNGTVVARPAGRLVLDPGLVLKLNSARIELERGAGSFIAEGTENRPVVMTSLADDRFGGSGSFDSDANPSGSPQPGDWSGLYFGQSTSGSIDNSIIAYGGGESQIEGGDVNFNVIEMHRAEVRITNSTLQDNASGASGGIRNGRGANAAAVIYARASQPIIVDNIFEDNAGPVLNINANSLKSDIQRDSGRSTARAESYQQFDVNRGPLVRLNQLDNNATNGLLVRGEELTVESVWDDTDIVHVLRNEITVDNHHTFSGLTLQSSNAESLIVKLAGNNAGFTATGTPVEIEDRIGGTIHVLGTVGHPVVLTHLADDSVGAGFTPRGTVQRNTNNTSSVSSGNSGGWRGLRFDEFSNDRNVAIVRELENPLTNGRDLNRTPTLSQLVGTLAPDQKSGDENRRLGFEVKGFISPTDPDDVDVYSFRGTAGTGVWLDIDRTDPNLDAVIEVVNAAGTVLARSVAPAPSSAGNINAATLTQNPLLGGDHYTQNFRDPGLFYVLPGTAGQEGTYFIRVRSKPDAALNVTNLNGESKGEYRLQVRLDQVQEFPGSTVRFSDIRFAQTAIDVDGLPARSPLLGEAGETSGGSFGSAQTLVNLLETDMAALGISGSLSNEDDVDWYQFDMQQTGVQVIGGVNDDPGTIAVVLDIDYADGAVRADTTIAVFDQNQNLIYVGRESNVDDDQASDPSGSIDDLSRGSLGKKDPYIGPIHLVPDGTYYVAVMSDRQLPSALMGAYQAVPTNAQNTLVRLEPVNSVVRVVEDHIGFQGYKSGNRFVFVDIEPSTPTGLFDISNGVVASGTGLDANVTPFTLQDVPLYVATDVFGDDDNDGLFTVDPFESKRFLTRVSPNNGQLINGDNDAQDIVIRSDGRMFAYTIVEDATGTAGRLVELDPATGAILSSQNDNIPGESPTPNTSSLNANLGGRTTRAEEFATTDQVDALTFERRGTRGPAAAPVPFYDVYYSVAESTDFFANSSKLYRARENGDATPQRAENGNRRYGAVGDIQPSDVSFASTTLSVFDTANPANVTRIRIESKLAGDIGNIISLNIFRPTNNNNAVVQSVFGTTINLAIGGTGGPPPTNGPSAGAIVDAINNHPEASQLVTAVVFSGNGNNGDGNNGTSAINVSDVGFVPLTGGNDGVLGPVGRVTGMTYSNFFSSGNLYGVTSTGQFIEFSDFSGTVFNRVDYSAIVPEGFAGLTLGPQNAEGGRFANMLFATSTTGRLFAFDTSGNLQPIFENGATSIRVSGMEGNPVGLAFSPLDFNLWHPTMKRGNDAGHGINPVADSTRVPNDHREFYPTSTGPTRRATQAEGGASFHFGFEEWVQNPNADTLSYLTYGGRNAQWGILNTAYHSDLSSNTQIRDSYNFPAGALGSLTTNSFSLAGTRRDDRPTLYFNYFLETENHPGSNVTSDVNDPFRDSARVFASRDGGNSWELVATNNSQLSAADPNNFDGRAELPGFLSHLSDAGLNSENRQPQSRQIVQELMDNTGSWRQARVDLSTFANESNVMLRVDFSTAGAMDDPSLGSVDSRFGEFSDDRRSIRSLDNAFEGFYIDDIIVGYAERGEMVSGTNSDANVTDLFAGGARTRDRDPGQFPDINNGPYQLEIRRTDEHVFLTRERPIVGSIFDTNDRHVNEATQSALLTFEPASPIPSLTVSDTTLLGGFTASQIAPWTVTSSDPFTGTQSLQSGAVSATQPVSIFEATPADLGSTENTAGTIRFAYKVSSAQDLHGLRFFIDGVAQNLISGSDDAGLLDPTFASGEQDDYQVVEFSFGSGNPTFSWVYDFSVLGASQGQNAAFIDDLELLQGGTGQVADRNRERPQGMLILESNFISGSSGLGIDVSPGTTQGNGSVPHPGSTINFPQLNSDRLVPGVVIQNNVISGSSAIRFAGETTASPQRPVPFGRIVNNTLVGDDRSGTGIDVVGLASPTLLNNLVTDFSTGIRNGGVGSVIRSNFFQDNGSNGATGTEAIVSPASDPLFLDAGNGNFYLQSGSNAIDSSQNTEQDRLNYVTFKTELGIPASPIVAPDRDVYGQLRIDSDASPGGGGSKVFKDRGAVDRADEDAPYATLLNPIDNDALGLDQDPSDNIILLTEPLVENFTVLLGDGRGPDAPFEGTGVNGRTVDDPNDPTVAAQAVTVEQNGQMLTQGVDYFIGYNELSGILLITPVSTLWEQGSVYTVTLDNNQIEDNAGNKLRPNEPNGETRFIIIVPEVEIDFGNAPDSYRTLLASDGPRHVRAGSLLPQLGVLTDGEPDGQPTATATGDDLNVDDEEGLPVGSFVGSTTTEGLFLADTSLDSTSDPSEVVAFLNRNDPAGALLPITVTGTGKLDAWIDFNADGDFADLGERVFTGVDVVDGENLLRVVTPATATAGLTFARFRVSEEGSETSFGLVVGGEVEDYQVNILDVAAPTVNTDDYSLDEDTVLTVDPTAGTPPTLFDNDVLPTEEFVQSRYIIDGTPISHPTDLIFETEHGTVRVDDPATGAFTYTPEADYYGPDSFRYRVSTQRNDGPEADAVAVFATVNITVNPVNDVPGVSSQNLRTIEDIQEENTVDGGYVIPASVLLDGTTPDADPNQSGSPQDESNQQVFVQSITTAGGSLDVNNPAPITTLRGGTVSAQFDDDGNITSLLYVPAQDFNSENLPDSVGEFLDDEIEFTVVDDGESLPVGDEPAATPMPLTATATAFIRVTPQNDPPVPVADDVSVSDPASDYVTFFTDQGLTAPVPMEDQSLVISSDFLLRNDSQARATAADENTQFNGNDGTLQIVDVSLVDPTLGKQISIDSSTGDIVFIPEDDIFGEVFFTYTVEDAGIDQAAGLDTGDNPFPKVLAPLRTTVTSRIFIEPVNDIPVAVDRAYEVTEAVETRAPNPPATPASITITGDQLLQGDVDDQLNPTIDATASDITLPAPFNEDNQSLRVNSVTSEGTTLTSTGSLDTASGGTIDVEFDTAGFLVQLVYTPPVDYNSDSGFFVPSDEFTYTIVDDGTHEFPVGTALTPDTAPAESVEATVTLTVDAANDLPVFDLLSSVDILERDDLLPTRVSGFFTSVGGGPLSTALDEQDPTQTVSFTIRELTTDPTGLMTRDPDVSSGSFIEFFPAPDQFGSATYEVTATDSGTPNQSISKTFTVNVRPVNDAPRFDPNVAGTSDSAGPDEAYSVAANDFDGDSEIDDATITYVLKEDNTQAGGTTEPYFIPLRALDTAGYDRIGLLDVFRVGPDNEEAALPGGSQVVDFLQAGNDMQSPSPDRLTDRGGVLTPVFDTSNTLIGLNYVPPTDFNVSFAGRDSFTYTVRDRSTTGGETFSLTADALVADRLTATNRVELVLNPVNDRPQFVVATERIDVREDSSEIDFISYASSISAGPPNTAFDEISVTSGQLVQFNIAPLDFDPADAPQFFSQFPEIDEQSGLLRFRPATDVFGEYRFEITLQDRNRDGSVSDDIQRGELNTSLPVTLTINVQPINDPPMVDPAADPLDFELLEDGSIDILVSGDNTSPGLLDVFVPGPNVGPTDESADIAPRVGGNQTVSLGTPIPQTTAAGGTLQFLTTGGTPRLRYTPRANFVGQDSFIYTVRDNGVTVDINGNPFSDPRIAANTVTFDVLPVNDAPLFSGAGNVESLEDEGFVAVNDWATNVQAGPVTAFDEIDGLGATPPQTLQFEFTQLSSNPELFVTSPSAIIDPETGKATLTYETAPDANGIAAFEVVLKDSGPRDASIGDQFESSPPRTFLIDVQAVNDPPSFDLANPMVQRAEDSGPFSVQQAINISPGPSDESTQTVAFDVLPLAPEFASLFSEQPTVNGDGVLRFTTAPNRNTDNANGPAIVRIVGRDSAGAMTEPKEFTISISEVNDAPRAFSDTLSGDEDTVLTFNESVLKANDVDPDLNSNANEVVRVVMPPESLSVSGATVTFDQTTGQISYDPTDADVLQSLSEDESLTDSFAYSLVDAAGATSNLVTVSINVAGVNDAPRVVADSVGLEPTGSTIIPVLDNDSDVDGTIDVSSVQIDLQPAFGSAVALPDGTIRYTPFASFSIEDTFTYRVADNDGEFSQSVTVVISDNEVPVARDDAKGTFLNEPVLIDVAANDSDADGTLDLTSIRIVQQPARGQVVPQGDGTVRYTPADGFVGRDSFQYVIADNQGRESNVATVSLRVVASRLQNPDRINDVDDSGSVSARDALLVINLLTRNDATSIPVQPGDRGPNFFDTNGNLRISASDALQVINALSRQNVGSGISGEQILRPTDSEPEVGSADETESFEPSDLSSADKIVDTAGLDVELDETVDQIASDREQQSDSDSVSAAIDAAMADLL